jgi:hypothetical protein
LEECEVLDVSKGVETNSCKKQKNRATIVLEPVIFQDSDDAHDMNNDEVQNVGCQVRSQHSLKKKSSVSTHWSLER